MTLQANKIYEHFKAHHNLRYDEEHHCKLLIKIMFDKSKGCHTWFCTEAMIDETTFYKWLRTYPIFYSIYNYCKLISKRDWYEQGKDISSREFQLGTMNYEMDHWKLMGWAKFGISRTSKIKLNLEAQDTPAKHYEGILRQASEGDFTAAEFKQLMEAINVGLNVHQVFELQKQIDELKSDLETMTDNRNVTDSGTNKRITEKN